MAGLTLLQRARALGLHVTADHGVLRIRGLRRHEHVARELLASKGEVLAELEREAERDGPVLTPELIRVRTVEDLMALDTSGAPPTRCYACRGTRWWRLRRGGPWTCGACHPPAPAPDQIVWKEAADA